jgi:hypothetical protein
MADYNVKNNINYNADIRPYIEKYTYRKLTEMLWQTEEDRKHFDKVHRGKLLSKQDTYARDAIDKYIKILFNELNKRHRNY